MSQLQLFEAYTRRLKALKDHLPQGHSVHEKYVHQYHELLDIIEATTSLNLSGFRVPASELQREFVGGQRDEYGNFEEWHSEEERYERAMLMMKMDSILSFFTLVIAENTKSEESKTRIGFRPQ